VDSSDTIHVVWNDLNPGNYEIFYTRSTDGGGSWAGIKRLTWTSGSSVASAIAVDSSDTLHLIWQDDTQGNFEIYHRKSTDGGVNWSGSKRLTWTSDYSSNPNIVVDKSDNLHVIWQDGSPWTIYYKRSADNGVSWSGATRLTWGGSSSGPAAAVDSSDNIRVAWITRPASNLEIYYRGSTDGGMNWSGSKRLTWTSGDSYNPAIATDSSNAIHVVMRDDTPGNYEIYHKRSTNGGVNWSTAKRLSWNSGMGIFPTIAVDSSNNIHVVWHDDTPGNKEIFYKKGIQ
jgi:hypothetical protein